MHGDNAARKELYTRYSGRLLAVGLRYTGSRDAAEDILHDVFLQAFSSMHKFTYRGDGSLFAWLNRVTVNMSLEYLRRLNRTGPTIDIDTLDNDPALNDEGDDCVERIPPAVLMQFIAGLPDGYRTVFNLYTFEGKSHKEIAAMLGINEKSSSSQLSRAKNILIRKIRDYLEKTK